MNSVDFAKLYADQIIAIDKEQHRLDEQWKEFCRTRLHSDVPENSVVYVSPWLYEQIDENLKNNFRNRLVELKFLSKNQYLIVDHRKLTAMTEPLFKPGFDIGKDNADKTVCYAFKNK